MNKRPILSVQGVTKRFGGLVAVNEMSFNVGNHEMIGVIGPNGSGKTTMANALMRLIKATGRIKRGQVLHLSEDILKISIDGLLMT